MKQANSIQGTITPTASWFKDHYGIGTTDPFTTDLDEVAEKNAKKSRVLYERYPDLPLGEKDPAPKYFAQEYDPRIVCTVAYGASDPAWDPGIGSFWPAEGPPVWSWVKTIADVEKIKIPNWEDVSLIQKMLQQHKDLQKKTKYQFDKTQTSFNEFPWKNPHTGEEYRFCNFIAFIDLIGYLMGSVRSMELLALDGGLSRALMEKCFEISKSFSDFMREIFKQELKGFASLGGDSSCMFSPDMYRDYAMAYDEKVIRECRQVPCNLHSCGPSPHLYEVWAEYKNRDRIVLMQTRAIPGQTKRLRQALPDTYLMLTMHAPQIDFENEYAGRIKELVWQFAEAAGGRDLQISAFINKSNARTDQNVRAFYKAIEAVNNHIAKG
jgi:hypothetical protein